MPAPKDKKKREEWIEKLRIAGRGRKHTEEELKKMSLANRGVKNPMYGRKMSEEAKRKISKAMKGRKITAIHRKRISEARKKTNGMRGVTGPDHPNWQGGITPENLKIRKSREYKKWRTAVFERDDYTCQECSQRGYDLHAHHIKPFSTHKEERLNVDNGMTLCVECHRDTDSFCNPEGYNQYTTANS